MICANGSLFTQFCVCVCSKLVIKWNWNWSFDRIVHNEHTTYSTNGIGHHNTFQYSFGETFLGALNTQMPIRNALVIELSSYIISPPPPLCLRPHRLPLIIPPTFCRSSIFQLIPLRNWRGDQCARRMGDSNDDDRQWRRRRWRWRHQRQHGGRNDDVNGGDRIHR